MVEINRILAPTDFSAYSKQALRYAAALAQSFQGKLYVMHVYELALTGAILPAEAYPEVVMTEEQTAEKERLNQIADALRSAGIEVEPVFALGRPYIEIVRAARDLEVDVIVLATRGRQGLSHLIFGSTAERVVRLAACPVLTVKQPEHEFLKDYPLLAEAAVPNR